VARLIYSMLQSADGYTADERGAFGWAAPDERVHAYVNALASSVGTYLYGRRMYDVMAFWETAPDDASQPAAVGAWARHWRAADKVVYSRTLDAPRSARTRIERAFEPDAVRALVAGARRDVAVSGPELAAQALRAGLVDEIQQIVFPVIVGGGTRFLPAGVRLDLALLEARDVGSGVVVLRHAVRR